MDDGQFCQWMTMRIGSRLAATAKSKPFAKGHQYVVQHAGLTWPASALLAHVNHRDVGGRKAQLTQSKSAKRGRSMAPPMEALGGTVTIII